VSADLLREKLIQAGRVLAGEGQGDYVAGHVTVRSPDEPNVIFMKPANVGLDEITRETIVTVNLEGEKIAGAPKRHSEVFIHTEIMRARPDVQSVIHTHAMHAVVFSSLGKTLLPVGNDGTFFVDNLPIFDESTDLITSQARGRVVATRLGSSMALILRNHGIATAGRTIEEAVWWALKLERACQAQLLAESAGGPKLLGNFEDTKAKGAWANRTELHESVFAYLSRKYAR
jgi:L-ribulose-5-phosphate 4-epimerase